MTEERKRRRDDRPVEEIPFEEKGDDIVYSPVPPELDEGPPGSNLPPEAPETPTPRAEHEVSKKGEERIAKQQAKK